jgi:hypothetical protein
MTNAKVERRHREAAMRIGGEYDIEKMHPLVRAWLETGKEPSAREHFSAAMLCVRARCEAQALADTEAAARAGERARVLRAIDNVFDMSSVPVTTALRSLRRVVESGEFVARGDVQPEEYDGPCQGGEHEEVRLTNP